MSRFDVRLACTLYLGLTLLSLTGAYSAPLTPGELDSGFTVTSPIVSSPYGAVFALLVQADGRILVGGDLSDGNELVRLKSNGQMETIFTPDSTNSKPVRALAVDTDGRIVVLRADDSGMDLLRYNADGMQDRSFQPPFFAGSIIPLVDNGALCSQADGKLIVGGAFSSISGVQQRVLARLHPDGSLDTTFQPRLNSLNSSYLNGVVRACYALSNGQVLVAGTILSEDDASFSGVIRVNADGSLDRSFHVSVAELNPFYDRGVTAMTVQSDLRIVIGGDFGQVNGTARRRVARLNSDGTLDLSFDPGVGPNGDLSVLVVQPGGKVLIGGEFTAVDQQARKHIARLAPDGQVDLSFFPMPGLEADSLPGWREVDINALATTPDAGLLVGGRFSRANGTPRAGLAKLLAAEHITTAPLIWQQPAGVSVAAGSYVSFEPLVVSDQPTFFQWRLNDQDFPGATNLWLTFSHVALTNSGTYTLRIQNPFGTTSTQPARLIVTDPSTSPGALDPSFDPGTGPNGPVFRVVTQPDGRILIAGSFVAVDGVTRPGLARLEADGPIDRSFDPGSGSPPASISFLAVQSDGRILAGGSFTNYNGVARPGAVRMNPDGSIDPTFDPPSTVQGLVALYSDHKTIPHMPMVRLQEDGSLDPTFASPSVFATVGFSVYVGVQNALVDAKGKLDVLAIFNLFPPRGFPSSETRLYQLDENGSLDLVFIPSTLGRGELLFGDRDDLAEQPGGGLLVLHGGGITRYRNDGSVDPSFTSIERDRPIQRLKVQPDGKIVVAGLFMSLGGVTRRGLARLKPDGALDPGFDAGAGLDASESTSSFYEFASDIALQPDGNILLAGMFLTVNGKSRPYLARLIGSEPFGPAVIAVSPVSQIAMAEQKVLLSVVAPGNPPPVFQWQFNGSPLPGATNATLVLTNVTASQAGVYVVAASNSFGRVESAPATVQVLPVSLPGIVAQPQGGAVSEGANLNLSITATNLLPLTYQWRRNGTNIAAATNTTLVLPNVHLTDSGSYSVRVSSEVRSITSMDAIVEVRPSYSVDPNFNLPRLPADFEPRAINAMVVQPDGKLLVTGGFTKLAGAPRNRIARLNADGSLDTSFDPGEGVGGGYFTGSPTYQTYLDIQALALQPDGRILIGGRFTSVKSLPYNGIARLHADGTPDTTFAASGVTEGPFNPIMPFSPTLAYVSSIVLHPDGRILIAGPFHKADGVARNCLARLNPTGTLDLSFDPGIGLLPPAGMPLLNTTFRLALEPDGDVIVQGYFGRAFREDIERFGIACFKPNGALDLDFHPVITPAEWTAEPHSLTLTADNGVVLTGSFTNVNSVARARIARLNSDGTLDLRFNPRPIPDAALNVTAQPDGKLFVYGDFTNWSGVARVGIARLNLGGAIDPSFDPGTGPSPGPGSISAVAFTPTADIVIAGSFTEFAGASRDGIALLYGYDPRNPRLTLRPMAAGNLELSIRTLPGKIYQIQSTRSLLPISWKTIQTLSGDGSIQAMNQRLTSGEEFYRLRLQE